MLKHLLKNALKMIEKVLLYSKKPVIIPGNEDIRSYNNDNEAFRTDVNLEDRVDKFEAQIDLKYVYRIPLKYLCNLGKITFPTIGAPDAQIVFVRAPYLQYQQILLAKNFRQYHLETIMLSLKVLRMGIQ